MNKLTILTSSRADYSIYRPLLYFLHQKPQIILQIIAFGTHTSEAYGHTVDDIRKDGFEIVRELPFVLDGTTPGAVALSMARTMKQFSEVWNEIPSDLIICLGDRYEMFAAVAASIPFNIPVAHIHGGETTLGAMDNIFRHSLSHMSQIHFTCAEPYRKRVIELTGDEKNVFNTGALSIDNLKSLQLLNIEEFSDRFGVDLGKPTLLTTFHPETISFRANESYASELSSALSKLSNYFQVLITMPNADTLGNIIRSAFESLALNKKGSVYAFENLGTIGYLSAMKHCKMLVGNTSSGFVEAAYFPKWVVNLGKRQEGRLKTQNIRTIPIKESDIIKTVMELDKLPIPLLNHPYGNGTTAKNITEHILEFLESKKVA